MASESQLQSRVLKQNTATARTPLTVPATPIYRAGQTVRQIRFPGRRKVVKKYGKGNTEKTPGQRTLTQIGYILDVPQNELQGVESVANANEGGPRLRRSVEIDANARVDGNSKKQPKRTPKKPRSSTHCDPAQSVLTTPTTGRTEIPSSQPSPFTPMVLSNRSQNLLNGPQSSPLSDKGLHLFSGCAVDVTRVARNPKDCPSHVTKRQKANPALEPQSGHVDLKPPLHPKAGCSILRSSQYKERTSSANVLRSSSLEGLGRDATLNKVCSSQRDAVKGHNLTTSAFQRGASSQESTVEIPDTDDEEDDVKTGQCSVLRDPAATRQQDAGVAGNDEIPSESPMSSFDLSPPSGLEPRTPITRPRGQLLHTAERIQVRQVGHGADIKRYKNRSAMLSPSLMGQLFERKQSVQSQGLESQRVPLDVISHFEPHTDRSDIIICTDPVQVQGMIGGAQKYEFRGFKIPQTVCRFWIYVTEPVCELRYMAVIDAGFQETSKTDNRGGMGTVPSSADSTVVQFAYRLLQVYQLNNPVSLGTMKKNGWMDAPPARYTYIPPAVVGSLLSNLRCVVVDNARVGGAGLTNAISHGVESQHSGDIIETRSHSRQESPVAKGDHQKLAVDDTSMAPSIASATRVGTRGAPRKVAQCKTRATRSSKATTISARVPAFLSQDTQSATTIAWSSEPIHFAALSRSGNTSNCEDTQEASAVARMKGAVQAQSRWAPRHEFQSQQLALSATGVSQLDLPESLYEDMRQAPPAVVLDSEDSEDD